MESKGLITYEDLIDMRSAPVETDELGRPTLFSEQIQYYCDNALDYIDLFKEHKINADLSGGSLSNLPLAIGLFHEGNISVGMTEDDSIEHAKEQVAGYVFFALHNACVKEGYSVRLELTEDESGLDLLVSDGYDSEMLDVSGRLDEIFDLIDIEHEGDSLHIEVKLDDFYDAVFGNTWGIMP